ncbi:hypothetical protein NPIL_202461 [Nephila pilipes]|uniref:Uncharacterized protein n=1 Tax=Nephila pilipes TaxID=299642 RepID=A0A8X6IY21_NEPPI|nr:hypothetical protein NPIL_202461 [Nephila pilipes]
MSAGGIGAGTGTSPAELPPKEEDGVPWEGPGTGAGSGRSNLTRLARFRLEDPLQGSRSRRGSSLDHLHDVRAPLPEKVRYRRLLRDSLQWTHGHLSIRGAITMYGHQVRVEPLLRTKGFFAVWGKGTASAGQERMEKVWH